MATVDMVEFEECLRRGGGNRTDLWRWMSSGS